MTKVVIAAFQYLIFIGIGAIFTGCSSTPILAKDIEVKVTRDHPAKDCQEIGPVQGQTLNSSGQQEEAMIDLKKDASLKGANFVHVEQFSAYGTAVNGTAYYCP